MTGVRRQGRAVVSALLVFSATTWARPVFAIDKAACVSAAESGQRLRKAGRLVASRDQLQVCANPDCPDIVSQDCTHWLGEVQRSVASIVVTARDTRGQPVDDVKVSFDGAVLADPATSTPIEVDPGDHVLRCEHKGFAPTTTRVLIADGERRRDITFVLAPAAAVSPFPHGTSTALGDSTATSTGGETPPPSTGGGIPAISWLLGGVGVAALGVGTYLGFSEVADQNYLHGQPCAATHTCDVSAIQTKIDLTYVSFGVGAVAIGAAIVLAILHSGHSSAAARAAALR